MNELKPEDVVRALECCANRSCEGCPLERPNEDCVSGLPKAALALLREKDAEIERLKDEYEIKCETRFGKITIPKMRSLGEGAELIYKEIRAEAITEFALRLKSCEFYEVADQYDGMQYVDFCDWVDKIVKEMKEGEDGKSDI
jgi:hypothetical protein